jgi:hypothetical protein
MAVPAPFRAARWQIKAFLEQDDVSYENLCKMAQKKDWNTFLVIFVTPNRIRMAI